MEDLKIAVMNLFALGIIKNRNNIRNKITIFV